MATAMIPETPDGVENSRRALREGRRLPHALVSDRSVG